jgi:hypothetical protein
LKLAVAEGRTYDAEDKEQDTAAVERLRTRDRLRDRPGQVQRDRDYQTEQ